MTYIENIFLCLALPMLLSLLFTSGSPRRFTLFVVLGMATCLLSAYVSSFFMGRHQCSAVTTAIEIAPVCGILTGLALAYVFRRPWLTCTGTVGILGVCMVLHGIYNLLITADGFWQMVGYFFPSAIIVTLFAARLLHRGRHTVFR